MLIKQAVKALQDRVRPKPAAVGALELAPRVRTLEHHSGMVWAVSNKIKREATLTMILIAESLLRSLLGSLQRSQRLWILKSLLSRYRCTRNFRKSIRGRRKEISLKRLARKLVNILTRKTKSLHHLAGNPLDSLTDSISLILQSRRTQRSRSKSLTRDVLKTISSPQIIRVAQLASTLILEARQ